MKSLPITILTTEEIYTFSERFKELLREAGINDEFVDRMLPVILKENEDLSLVLARVASSIFTKKICNKDNKRDKAFIGLRDYINAFTHSPDEETAEAAIFLKDIIEKRGNTIHKLGNAAESAELNLLFIEMDKPEAQAALEKIVALSWYSNLKTEQVGFEEIYKEKVDTESQIDIPSTKEVRKSVSKILHVLIDYIEINAKYFADTYSSLADKIDELIADTVTVARARQTRKGNKEEE